MKILIAIIYFISLVSCQKGPLTPSENPVAPDCKAMRIVVDGEETLLEFTSTGNLSRYADQVINSAEKSSEFSIAFNYNSAKHSISFRNKIWNISILDDDKNGFEQGWLDHFGNGKLVYSIWEGLENGTVTSREETDFHYDNKGDAINYNSAFSINTGAIFKKFGNITYSNKVSPFATNPYQFIIELNWSPAAHNNYHLATEDIYTISNEGLDDTHLVIIKGISTYEYSWDSLNRIKQIKIHTTEKKSIKNKTTNTTTIETESKTKIIQIFYNC